MGVTHFLPQIVGMQQAAKLLTTGDLISAEEALRIGLILEVTEDLESCLKRSLFLAHRISSASHYAVSSTIMSLRRQQDEGLIPALQREADAQSQCYAHQDLAEGLEAVKNKRDPIFK